MSYSEVLKRPFRDLFIIWKVYNFSAMNMVSQIILTPLVLTCLIMLMQYDSYFLGLNNEQIVVFNSAYILVTILSIVYVRYDVKVGFATSLLLFSICILTRMTFIASENRSTIWKIATQFLIAFSSCTLVSRIYFEEFHPEGIEKRALIFMTPMMIVADMFILFGQFSDEFTQEIGKHACKAR